MKGKNVLVTGAGGFTAGHLIDLLRDEGRWRITGTDLRPSLARGGRACDLADGAAVRRLLRECRPGRIYHLAGTFSNDFETDFRNNVLTTRNLLDGVLELGLKCRILLIGSAAEYGMVSSRDNPVDEETPLRPVSVYGLTKAFQTLLMRAYVARHGLDIRMARTFNLLGAGASDDLFVGRVERQIAAYRRGRIKRIVVGSLEGRRDYLDVREAVADYVAIMERGRAGEIYNVGSGRAVRMRDLLRRLLRAHGFDLGIVREIRGRRAAARPEVPVIRARIDKVRALRASRGL